MRCEQALRDSENLRFEAELFEHTPAAVSRDLYGARVWSMFVLLS